MNAVLAQEAAFLCSRLREFENELLDDEVARQFFGHVSPPLARLEALLAEQVSA